MIVCLVAGYQVRRVQCKKMMSKEDLGRGEVFQGAFKTIGQWIQERICLLINMSTFDWSSHLKHWILKMIVWYGMVRGEEQIKFRTQS